MGKGSTRRPSFIIEEEYSLRWDLAFGFITPAEFDAHMKHLHRKRADRPKQRGLKELYE